MREVERDAKQIRAWMILSDLTPTGLAAELGVHYTLVSQTVSGTKNNRRVLKALRDKGCPVKWLALPLELDNTSKQPG